MIRPAPGVAILGGWAPRGAGASVPSTWAIYWLWAGWVVCTVAAMIWVIAGVAFSITPASCAGQKSLSLDSLMRRPPLDWDSPQTFSPLDRDAWKIVLEEADQGETLTFDVLLGPDAYIDTGRRLMKRLVEHYHPLAAHPFDDVPVVELLTAFELASGDISGCCRRNSRRRHDRAMHWRARRTITNAISPRPTISCAGCLAVSQPRSPA